MLKTRLKIYALLFILVISVDASLYFLQDLKGIINWESLIHAGWVVISAIFLLAMTYVGKSWIGYSALLIHFSVFLISLLNQFFPIQETFNYYCMLFNFGLFTVYYFSLSRID